MVWQLVKGEEMMICQLHEMVKHGAAKRTIDGFTQISKPSDNFMVQQFIDSDLGIDDLFVKGLLGE